MDRYWRRRLGRHTLLAGAALVLLVTGAGLLASTDLIWRISVMTGWVGAAFLAATLLLGPWNVIRGRPNPVSFDLRRDIGIWAAGLAAAHTGVGLFVHLRGRPLQYFAWDRSGGHLLPLRYDLFGVANWLGLAAVALLFLLGLISNDASLRHLGARRWKRVQRWAYAGAAAVALHGVVYQVAIEKRTLGMVVVFAGLIAGTMVAQLVGFRRVRRARGRATE